jgi:hypothetical protein
MQLRAELSTEDADGMDARTILIIEQKLANLADAIAARYFLQSGKPRHAEKIKGLA